MTDNRHEREVNVVDRKTDPSLGFVIDILDPDVQIEGRDIEDADIQVKPAPSGYQITIWWEEDGEKKQVNDIVRLEDPRDTLEANNG